MGLDMLNYFIKIFSGSFFRTLGKIFAFLIVGIIIAWLTGFINISSVNAKTSLPITNYSLATNICDWESSVTGANVTIKKCDNFSLSLNTSRTFPIPDMYSISYNGIVFNYQVSAANELYSYNIYTMQISFKVSSVNENFLNSFKVFIDGGANGYCTTCNSVDLISYSFEKQSNTGDYVLNLKYQPNVDGIRFVAIKFLSNLSLDVVYPDLTYISDYVSSKAITTSIKSYSIYYDRTTESYQKETNSKIDETNNLLNSEDNDTSSSKCGVVCKLKGIWNGIIHLPQNIWNLMKGGFESITNAFVWIFDQIKSFFGDDDVDTNDTFFSSFEDIDHGGISSVISAPLKAVDKLTKPCNSVSLDILGADVELPCGDTLFWDKPEVSTFRITWNIILGGGIIYALMCKLFKVIEGLKNPDDSRIEVMKL